MNAPDPHPRRRAAVKAAMAPGVRLELPASVSRGPLLWRYVISLAVTHALALLVLLPWLFSWTSVVLFAVGVIFFGQGINLGYHRLLAHNSLAVPKWLEHALVVLALCNSQDTPVKWVASHRHHHKFSDVQADTHSPLAGFMWSHMNWLFFHNSATRGILAYKTYAHDLIDDPFYRRLEREWWAPVVIYLAHAFLIYAAGVAIGWIDTGTFAGGIQLGLSFLVWGVILRTVVVWHITWSINSLTHVFGYRSYDTRENSRNNWLLGYIASGEGWHNNHHHDSASASNQHRWWEFDLTYLVICGLEKLGLAKDVIRPRAQRHADRNRA
jgi:stearoyl-CoA desaturase (delta-9 desaturase)